MLKEETGSSVSFIGENICTMVDLFDKAVVEGAR